MSAIALIDSLLNQLGAPVTDDEKTATTMQCVRVSSYSDNMQTSLTIDTIPIPTPSDGEILVKVYSVSLNPIDWKIAQGMLYNMKIHDPPLPAKFGYDFSGIITSIGPNVDSSLNLSIGTRVCGMLDLLCLNGTFSEYLVCPANNASILSNNISFDIGAGIPMVTLTAYQALITHASLDKRSGLKILVLGGSSSVGLGVIQISKHFKASIISTTSSQELLCKKYGATQVFNYKDKSIKPWYQELIGNDFDVLYDCIGGKDGGLKTFEYAQSVLKKDGTGVFISVNGSFERPKIENDDGKIQYCRYLIKTTTYLDDLLKLVSNGELNLQLDEDSPYRLNQFYDMVEKSIAGKAHGKLIMRFNE